MTPEEIRDAAERADALTRAIEADFELPYEAQSAHSLAYWLGTAVGVSRKATKLAAEVRQLTEDRDQASNLSDMRAKLLREAWDAHHNTMDERDALLADRDRAREVAVALEQENARLRDQMAAVEKFAAARAEYITAINNCPPDNSADYWRWQGHAEGRRQLSQTLGLPVAWPAGYEGGEH